MEAIQELRDRAKKIKGKIVLPEGEELRMIEAAAYISKEAIANTVLIGNKQKIEAGLKQRKADLSRIEIIEIESSPLLNKYADMFFELRKHKGITQDEARQAVLGSTLIFGALMVHDGLADGFVAGSVNTTRDVARAALWCIGLDRSIRTMSSSFVMVLPDKSFGADGVLIYADCGIVPVPSSRQLANIAISASDLMQAIFGVEPKVALLSYSTKGSGGEAPEIEKVIKALEFIKTERPDILIDGELQADSALVPEVAKLKTPDSPIKGKANVLIFPSLEAGNISYKLTQRLANARAIGPLLHGLLAPCSDLSRGCSSEDIIDIVAVTALRASYQKARLKS